MNTFKFLAAIAFESRPRSRSRRLMPARVALVFLALGAALLVACGSDCPDCALSDDLRLERLGDELAERGVSPDPFRGSRNACPVLARALRLAEQMEELIEGQRALVASPTLRIDAQRRRVLVEDGLDLMLHANRVDAATIAALEAELCPP